MQQREEAELKMQTQRLTLRRRHTNFPHKDNYSWLKLAVTSASSTSQTRRTTLERGCGLLSHSKPRFGVLPASCSLQKDCPPLSLWNPSNLHVDTWVSVTIVRAKGLLAPTPRTPPNHCPCLHSHMKIDYYRLSTELMVELAPSASMVVPEE